MLLLALVVLGPEKLPDAMRKMGQFYAEIRKMSSGFQQEFRAAIDEPVREIRETANTLRDSADLTKLQAGERDEKPKSAEMSEAGDPVEEPASEVPTFEPADGSAPADDEAPTESIDSKTAPFDDTADATDDEATDDGAPRVPEGPTAIPAPPAPFTGMSSAAPPPVADTSTEVADAAEDDAELPADAADDGADAQPDVDETANRTT